MKKLCVFILISIATICLLAATAAAQTSQEGVRARAIRAKYDAGRVDGMRVIVYLVQGDTLLAVDPSRDFRRGDLIKLEFESNFDGYVYFINISPDGKSAVIYPDAKAKEMNNIIRARQRYVLPQAVPFEFVDDQKGVEVIQVIMSRKPVKLFDDAIKNSGGELGETASSAADLMSLESKKSGIDTESSAKILPQGVRARSVRLAPPKEKDEQGTIIAVPDSKLRPSEVAVFEIRLRHI